MWQHYSAKVLGYTTHRQTLSSLAQFHALSLLLLTALAAPRCLEWLATGVGTVVDLTATCQVVDAMGIVTTTQLWPSLISYDIPGCSHPDISSGDLHSYRSELPRKYTENLRHLLAANSQAEYRARRLQVGLCKQTLFHGLPHLPLPVPSVFTMDIMHLSVLNDLDLILKLFLGKLDVYDPDDRENWDWAIFYRKLALWNAHGETVAKAVPFLPSSFGRAPRDLAKKLNTGYKAWEF